MSIDRCACGVLVDTDDGECYGEDGKLPARCQRCRDEAADACVDCGAPGLAPCLPGCPSRLP